MMTYAYDPYLPEGRTWRDLFDMVIVQVSTAEVEIRISLIFGAIASV